MHSLILEEVEVKVKKKIRCILSGLHLQGVSKFLGALSFRNCNKIIQKSSDKVNFDIPI